ncbi:hypothetical protein JCM16303_004772 [Sporobolomyces ruberrimus]
MRRLTEVVAKDALLEVYALQETSWKASGTGGRDQGTAKSLEPNVPARESLQAQLANPSTRSSDHYLATRSIVQSTQPSRNLAPNIDVQKPRPVVEYVPQPSFDDYAFPSFTPPDAFFTPTHTVPPPPSAATGYPPRRPSQNGSTQIWSPAPPTKPVTVSRPSISGPTLTPTSGSRVATQSPSVGSNGTSSMQQKTTSSLSSNAPAFESPSNAQTLAPPVSSSPRKVLLRGRTKSAENLRTPVLEKKPREEEVKKAEKVEKEHEKVEGKKPDSCAKEEQEVVFEPKEKKVEETRAVEKKIGLQTKPKLNANEETKREKKWVQSSKGQEKTVASKGKNVQQVKEPEKAIEKTEANNSKKETLLEEKVTPKVESRERAESIVGEIGPSSLVTLSPQSAKFVSQSPVQLDLPVADPRFSTVYALLHSTLLENAKLTLRLEAMTSAVSNGHDKVSSQDQSKFSPASISNSQSDPSTTTKQSELLQEALSTIVYLEDDLSFSTRETAKLLLENGKPRSDLELALNEYQELLEVSRRVAASRLGGGGGGGSGGSTKGKEVGGGTKSRGGEEGKGGGENGSRELKRTIDGFQQTGPI